MENAKTQKITKNSFLKGAAWIAAGGFFAKLVGALYRIPLTNAIGGEGLGLYQMVYPVYCLLLTVSATGIPSSIAKLTAERLARGEETPTLFKRAMQLFLLIGIVGSAIMALLAPVLVKTQGSERVLGGYYTLAPSVLLVSAISVFRGWFQGRNNMTPTALSEILEQLVKVAFGLLFAYLFRGNIELAVVFLLLAVSLSELFTLLFLFAIYRLAPAQSGEKPSQPIKMRSILRLSVPVTFNSALLPLSALLDSVLAPRLLGAYATNAVTLYGLFAGGAVTMINLPVSVCYGIAAASIPAVAGKNGNPRKRIRFALFITASVAFPCAVGLYLFAEPATRIIFRSLSVTESAVLAELVRALSVSALLLSCVQTLSACLTAQGKPQYAALSMLVAVTVKTGVYTALLKNPKISVLGLAYATNLCYLVAFLLDLLYNLRVSKKRKEW